jgi:hypothetical protein
MRKSLLATALLLFCGAVNAQDFDINTRSDSDANANSNSESRAGASSDNLNVVAPNQNTHTNLSTSTSTNLGVGITQTFEASVIPTETTQNFKTNTSVPLAAAVSFSSDYCGGTASGGASAAGISIGMAKPMMDGNCQALRRAEKFGTAAANAYNAGLKTMAGKLIVMQVWEICMAGNDSVQSLTAEACKRLVLVEDSDMPHNQPAHEQLPSEAPVSQPRSAAAGVSDPPTAAHAQKARITGSNGVSAELEEQKKIK